MMSLTKLFLFQNFLSFLKSNFFDFSIFKLKNFFKAWSSFKSFTSFNFVTFSMTAMWQFVATNPKLMSWKLSNGDEIAQEFTIFVLRQIFANFKNVQRRRKFQIHCPRQTATIFSKDIEAAANKHQVFAQLSHERVQRINAIILLSPAPERY